MENVGFKLFDQNNSLDNFGLMGFDVYDKWKIRLLYKEQSDEKPIGYKITHRFLYPYISGWYRGKWTHNPNDISKFPEEVQTFCKRVWTNRFKEGYKMWRESVGPWVE